MSKSGVLKPPVEEYYKEQLRALKANDEGPKPKNWKLSPKAVKTFILGSDKKLNLNGKEVEIDKKFYGDDALIERCIITLAGNRGLMLVGEPGTAKSMLSELLSAAICGCSTNTIQGTAGTTEDMVKYSWNYAMLLAKGPVKEALVPSPIYTAMEKGSIARFEEITRCSQEVQDSMISIMSDKILNVPELGEDGVILAARGFNVIATANIRDKGVNEMSSALKRRFNFETVFPINDISLEAKIIQSGAEKLLNQDEIGVDVQTDVVNVIATTFHELREGVSQEGGRIEKTAAVMSTAEAVSVCFQTLMHDYYYGGREEIMDVLVQNIMGTVIKENRDDIEKLRNYFNVIVKQKNLKEGGIWKKFYEGKRWIK